MDPEHSHAGAGAGHAQRPAARPAAAGCSLNVPTEPYHPAYFMINGRSMPDDMDPNYAAEYPHQPYNGNPHMHPGELVLLRIIGQGRWQHPFHEHANHVRILARDGNLILSQTDPNSPRRAAAVHHHHDSGPGDGRDLLLHRQGPELGHVRSQSRVPATRSPSFRARRMPTATTPALRRRSTISSGARTTTSRCRRLRSAMSPAAAR